MKLVSAIGFVHVTARSTAPPRACSIEEAFDVRIRCPDYIWIRAKNSLEFVRSFVRSTLYNWTRQYLILIPFDREIVALFSPRVARSLTVPQRDWTN